VQSRGKRRMQILLYRNLIMANGNILLKISPQQPESKAKLLTARKNNVQIVR
jgi:hypothetical protein